MHHHFKVSISVKKGIALMTIKKKSVFEKRESMLCVMLSILCVNPPSYFLYFFWAAHTLFVPSPPMRGAWCGLSTTIAAAIQMIRENAILKQL